MFLDFFITFVVIFVIFMVGFIGTAIICWLRGDYKPEAFDDISEPSRDEKTK